MLACSPGPFSPHPTDKLVWSLSLGWGPRVPGFRGLPAGFPLPSPAPHLDPKGRSADFLPAGAGELGAEGAGGGGGCCEEPPWIPGPGVHLQTDVSNESPGTRRAEAAGGLAGAEVMVNYFRAAPPPLSATTVAKIPRRQEQESGFHMG